VKRETQLYSGKSPRSEDLFTFPLPTTHLDERMFNRGGKKNPKSQKRGHPRLVLYFLARVA
jgi:hypothetical protein